MGKAQKAWLALLRIPTENRASPITPGPQGPHGLAAAAVPSQQHASTSWAAPKGCSCVQHHQDPGWAACGTLMARSWHKACSKGLLVPRIQPQAGSHLQNKVAMQEQQQHGTEQLQGPGLCQPSGRAGEAPAPSPLRAPAAGGSLQEGAGCQAELAPGLCTAITSCTASRARGKR